MVAWQEVPWQKIERHVYRLQKRIYRATQQGCVRTVQKLQKLLLKSWYARLLAVRRVTQDNRGKKTAGIDGVKSLKPPQRLDLARHLSLTCGAAPLRRTWVPKPGSSEQRALGIPVMFDRALQALVKLALEPEWEAKLSPHTYGFRPGRCCWDAMAAIFHSIKFRPQYVLKVDIAKCFDRISHQALLAKTQTFTAIRRQLKAWLRAGVMDGERLFPTLAGTPQGGVISPLAALIALHGMDKAVHQVAPEATVIAYADDCVVLHGDLSALHRGQQALETWLAEVGLSLNATKTRIAHTLDGDQAGFDFLGFHIRQHRVGKHQSGKSPGGRRRLGYKTLIKPAMANVQKHLSDLGRLIRRGQNQPQAGLIRDLNPKIRGWANYYRTWVSHATFERLDYLVWVKLRRWAHRRHSMKSATWVTNRYWRRLDSRLAFATAGTESQQANLTLHSEVPIQWHPKVSGNRSPYDGDWVYWSSRRGRHPEANPRLANLLKGQRGRCAFCGLYFQHDDLIEIDHINGDRRNSRYANLQALHGHCHDAKTREQGDYLPMGMRDKHQSTEERSARKRARSVLEQR